MELSLLLLLLLLLLPGNASITAVAEPVAPTVHRLPQPTYSAGTAASLAHRAMLAARVVWRRTKKGLPDMQRAMAILSIAGIAAALYFAWRYGVF